MSRLRSLRTLCLLQIADLHMHAKCEGVMGPLATLLGLTPLPEFRRHDSVRVTYTEEAPPAKASTGFEIRVTSCASDRHVTPLLRSLDVSYPVRRPWCIALDAHKAVGAQHGGLPACMRAATALDEAPELLESQGIIMFSKPSSKGISKPFEQEEEELDGEAVVKRPFQLRQRVPRASGSLHVRMHLHLGADADADKREVVLDAVFRLGPPPAPAAAVTSGSRPRAKRQKLPLTEPQSQEFSFLTQVQTY